MPWQQHVADVALEIDPRTGRYAYREIVLTVPRRSGKSTLLLALLLHRMIGMDRPQVAAFTMQNALQARLRMRREWHNEILRRSPLAQVYDFTGQPGAEALMFHNGSRIEVTASTSSSGHGATLDLAVVDEAFDQPDDRLEQAFRPAIRTQPNAQLWWVSTAGGPQDKWFRAKTEAARALASKRSTTAIFEWSAPEDADASDPAVWWECMPALGYVRQDGTGLTEQDIAEEFQAMTVDNDRGFRRAYLNQWVDLKSGGVLDLDLWASLKVPNDRVMVAPEFAVEVALDRSRSTIGAAWLVDGKPHVEVVEELPGTAGVVERLAELTANYGGSVAVDGLSEAAELIPDLEQAGVRVRKLNAAERAAACGGFYDLATTGGLSHVGDPALTAAIQAATWTTGSDRRSFERRRSAGSIAALYVVTFALHALTVHGPSVYEERGFVTV